MLKHALSASLRRGIFALAAAVPLAIVSQVAPAQAAPTTPGWGVYAGPAATGVAGADAYAASTGIKLSKVLDFLPTDSWAHLRTSQWVLDAHKNSPYPLELSVPMIPTGSGSSLAACAQGSYNSTWTLIAGFIADRGMAANTTIRPGWEANGTWMIWSAGGQAANYIGCFQQMVTSMKSVAPALSFNWSVASGYTKQAGEDIYPGDAFVDVVSVDVYDQSWYRYPTPTGQTLAQAQALGASDALSGNHGLKFWSAFAASHSKLFAISEWGLTWRSDGYGGGDNVAFADMMLKFVKDPANRVSFATYFNNPDSSSLKHNITGAGNVFPLSGAYAIAGMTSTPAGATAKTVKTATKSTATTASTAAAKVARFKAGASK